MRVFVSGRGRCKRGGRGSSMGWRGLDVLPGHQRMDEAEVENRDRSVLVLGDFVCGKSSIILKC